jgi:NAD+ synthase
LKHDLVKVHIVAWLKDYALKSGLNGFVVGVSGGVDSALTATLCAETGLKTMLLNMPIWQKVDQLDRSANQIKLLQQRFPNVEGVLINLTGAFEGLKEALPADTCDHGLSMANTRSRLRMTTLYAIGQANGLLVAGTGNKVEDFGVGFFTKYGDGGVDVSPIADLMKTEVFDLAKHVGVIQDIIEAPPTDGLWDDDRNDEDQIGATYPELEWAMLFNDDLENCTPRQKEVLAIYNRFHQANKHKMMPIPVCEIPSHLK